ncbi:MAG: hypothetical protein ACRBK7_14390 [Acidimicrobiales bacterium]
MRPDSAHVATKGSNVWLDGTAGEYPRLPLGEAPRERPEWSDDRAGVLQDAVWHPMTGWRVGPAPSHDPDGLGYCRWACDHCPGLMIDYPSESGEVETAWFPNASEKEDPQ